MFWIKDGTLQGPDNTLHDHFSMPFGRVRAHHNL